MLFHFLAESWTTEEEENDIITSTSEESFKCKASPPEITVNYVETNVFREEFYYTVSIGLHCYLGAGCLFTSGSSLGHHTNFS